MSPHPPRPIPVPPPVPARRVADAYRPHRGTDTPRRRPPWPPIAAAAALIATGAAVLQLAGR